MRFSRSLLSLVLIGAAACGPTYVVQSAPRPAPDRVPLPPPPPRVDPLQVSIVRPEDGRVLVQTSRPAYLAVFEIVPGRGAQMVRSAGGSATLMSRDEGYAVIRLPSGEIRRFNENCYATIGQIGNTEHENVVLGKAGRSRHRGIRPINRGVARNPVDHPNGGGAGKSKSGGGWQQLTSPWGLLAKGYRTRNRKKHSNRFILVRRDGRPMKNK
jgi:large subunit ribosomal protein L2